jgi:hypothetical protein
MTSRGALLVALWLQGAIAPAAGTPAVPTKARLELRGGADCLSPGDLASRVAARTSRVQFADDAAIYARIDLTSARPGNVVAEVVLATASAEPAPRRFVARSCAEAADAIALVIAVTLDPTLKLKRNGSDDTGGSAGKEAGADRAPVAPTNQAEQPGAPKPPPPPTIVETTPAPLQNPSPPTRWHFGLYAAGQTVFGPAPAVMPGVGLSGMAGFDREGAWAPALFIGFSHAWRDNLSEPGGTASFALDAATIDACPVRVGAPEIVVRPCASGLIGRLGATGTATEQAASSARPFATAGVAVHATFGTTVVVSARAGVAVTLLRDSYEFGGVTFHRADAITTALSLGVGLGRP